MSLITEQVERLRELSKQDKLGLIPWNGYSEILNQAADTIEQLAAKVRAENNESQPCEDAISRSDMLDAIGHGTTYTSEELQKIIKGMPPVNPQPKIGYWFAWKPEDDVWRTTCSECGEETRTLWDYCPNCGAKMIEPQESEGV